MSLRDPADAWDTPPETTDSTPYFAYESCTCCTATQQQLATITTQLQEAHAMIDQLATRINAAVTA